jgi:hypothetical protein
MEKERTHVREMILAEIQDETTANGIWDCFTKTYKKFKVDFLCRAQY